jgi:hypothetical protein
VPGPLVQIILTSSFSEYFRCPDGFSGFSVAQGLSAEEGYFAFDDVICYGRVSGVQPVYAPGKGLSDVAGRTSRGPGRAMLPFNLDDVVTNLRQERYAQDERAGADRFVASDAARSMYYFARPMLPVALRKYLQRIRLAGWDQIDFPRWPVDVSVDTLMMRVAAVALEACGVRRLPFIWFWPDGAPSCTMMTHDVESASGAGFCETLMNLDDSFDIKSAFQVIPESRGFSASSLAESIRRRGFEVNVHDLTHDGSLFQDRDRFLERAAQINRYVRDFNCGGFRAGAMYREQQWYDAFEFSYDMSVPNAAQLEPQRGGCCTVMPYFVGNILELPLTTTQDYSLFHILEDYSTRLWKQQIATILESHGLISFIAHPDYLVESRARGVYADLLAHLSELRTAGKTWIAVPAEIDRWWRNRRQMTLVPQGDSWRIDGPDSHRARLGYVTLTNTGLVYELDELGVTSR